MSELTGAQQPDGHLCGSLSLPPNSDGLQRAARRMLPRDKYAVATIDMNQVLVTAIEKRLRLRFRYNGRVRLVEPQCYGIGTKGTELLRAHQLQGGQEREPLFDVSKIADLKALTEVFDRPGPNYKRNDSAMKTIFAQL